jgi:hypothetical protein
VSYRARSRGLRNFATLAALDLGRISWVCQGRGRVRHTQKAKESETVLSRGLCTERKKGELLGLLLSSVCSYMVYILGLTVLETVVRELRGLRRFKCPGGDAVTGAQESAGKAGRNSGNAQIVCRVGGGRRDAPGDLWCSVTHPAGAAAYHRLEIGRPCIGCELAFAGHDSLPPLLACVSVLMWLAYCSKRASKLSTSIFRLCNSNSVRVAESLPNLTNTPE